MDDPPKSESQEVTAIEEQSSTALDVTPLTQQRSDSTPLEENGGAQHSPLNDLGETPAIARPVLLLPPVEVCDLDWDSIAKLAKAPTVLLRSQAIVEGLEELLAATDDSQMLFDSCRTSPSNRAITVAATEMPLWIIGDLHGDLLTLEAALALIERESHSDGEQGAIIFLGDLFDDGGLGLAVLMRVFELIVNGPERICVIAGNHDEALSFADGKFVSSVEPSDFADYLNANLHDDWVRRAGLLAIQLFASAPRALFFPDGLLASHGGFPLTDLHQELFETGNWNHPEVLSDFVWVRAHPKARKKLPNRYTRGSQFGYEDFACFCGLATALGRPVTHLVRGHDHVDERYAIYAADRPNPILTTVALSRRLGRENFGSFERVPTVARYVAGALPQVYRIHLPGEVIRQIYPESWENEASTSEIAEEKAL